MLNRTLIINFSLILIAAFYTHCSKKDPDIQRYRKTQKSDVDDGFSSTQKDGIDSNTNHISLSMKKLRSWDIILSESELSAFTAKIDFEKSNDFDVIGGEVRIIDQLPNKAFDSESQHSFVSSVGGIKIEVYVFTKMSYAMEKMQIERSRTTKKENVLKKYGEGPGPFTTDLIDIKDMFGDESFCHQWSKFSPEILFRLEHIVVSVSAGDFGKEKLPYAISVARMQEKKIRKLLQK